MRLLVPVLVLLFWVGSAFASPLCSLKELSSGDKTPVSALSNDLFLPGQMEPALAGLFEQLFPEFEYVAPLPACEVWGTNLGELFLPRPALLRFRSADSQLPNIEILISDSKKANAIALPPDADANQPAQIILSRGLLSYLTDRAELAFVLAHEMSHIRQDHFPLLPPFLLTESQLQRISEVHKSWELEADRQALSLLAERGMNLEAPVRALRRLEVAEEKEAAPDAIESHPKMSERIAAITRLVAGS